MEKNNQFSSLLENLPKISKDNPIQSEPFIPSYLTEAELAQKVSQLKHNLFEATSNNIDRAELLDKFISEYEVTSAEFAEDFPNFFFLLLYKVLRTSKRFHLYSIFTNLIL